MFNYFFFIYFCDNIFFILHDFIMECLINLFYLFSIYNNLLKSKNLNKLKLKTQKHKLNFVFNILETEKRKLSRRCLISLTNIK